jgi:hypothetical protein
MPTWAWVLNLGINMNIELDEVVVLDVSDDALELAAGGAQGGRTITHECFFSDDCRWWIAELLLTGNPLGVCDEH